jgi:hypothetical protein
MDIGGREILGDCKHVLYNSCFLQSEPESVRVRARLIPMRYFLSSFIL